MLIETISQLAHDIGASRISIEVPPSNGGSVQVMVVAALGHSAKTVVDEKKAARVAALAQPLVLRGHAGEMDARLVRLVDDLSGDMVAAANALPETEAVKRRKELKEGLATKAATKDDDKTGVAKEPTADDADAATTEALASGDADSL